MLKNEFYICFICPIIHIELFIGVSGTFEWTGDGDEPFIGVSGTFEWTGDGDELFIGVSATFDELFIGVSGTFEWTGDGMNYSLVFLELLTNLAVLSRN